MNKQSNVYTIIYIVVLVVVVGVALALTATALKPKQIENANADKMRQILESVHIRTDASDVISVFNESITDQFIVNSKGEKVDGNAFDVDVAAQSKIADASERLLPVYVYTSADSGEKYILPVYGAGLWGPIWGYLAIDSDGSTIYGAYFGHQGETPGLGAEIEKPLFTDQFNSDLHLFKDDKFMPIAVVKVGQVPHGDEDYVDGVSGGTITSKGVSAMLSNCISPYQAFLRKLQNK